VAIATDLRDVEWGDVISVDIETHGVDNEVIDCVSFSDGKTTATLRWTHEVLDYMNYLFALPGRIYAIHNSPFDVPRLMASGVNISQDVLDHRLFDTMFGAVILQPDLHKGLGRISTVFVDTYPWKWKNIKHGDAEFYSAKDSYVTAYLALSEMAVMKKLGCWNLFMGQGNHPGPGVMATVPLLAEMNRVGIKTDPVFANAMFHKLSMDLLEKEREWAEKFPGVDPHSNKSVADFLYGTWKLPVQRTQEDGVTVDELALVRLRIFVDTHVPLDAYGKPTNYPWEKDERCTPGVFNLLLELRNASKMLSTYVVPIIDGGSSVHPSYLPRAKDSDDDKSKGNTATGRLATTNPNIQNQPKSVRYMYVPDSPDMVFIQADFKSAELYSMAYCAQDDRLIADLQGDMHTANAKRFNTTRSTAKNVTYAGQYLAGPAKVSEMILAQEHQYVPVAECKHILDGQAAYYFKTAAYKRHLTTLCETQKYIINPFGRIRFFHSGQAPAAVDFIPQSVVADVLWCVLKPVADIAKKYGGRCTTTVHDSILIQVHKDHKEAAAREMLAAMTKTFDCVAPGFFIPVELEAAEAGESWGHVKKYTI
jgi:DNA polymerase I-like protein with 3'-5' exonuclease and polymerase domains